MAASKDALNALHAALAKCFTDALGRSYTDEQGNPAAPPASLLNTIRQFLKDNGIEAEMKPGGALDNLHKASLPFTGDDGYMPSDDITH